MKHIQKNDFISEYAARLNENQQKAMETVEGPVLLLAVPGSGKTTVLVTRLGYMIYSLGIEPENILTLTYTIAATNDMARRFQSVFGDELSGRLEFRTINGICAKIIQRYSRMKGSPAFELITDEKSTGKILTEILAKNLPEYPTESDIKTARTLITFCKNMLLTDEKIKGEGEKEKLPLFEIYQEYNRYLRNNHLMDYDDQMIYAYKILKSYPELLEYYQNQYRYILVDEAQDTSRIQHIIISLLAGEKGNLFMVGDEDQSIYGFRAAYPEALLNFEKDHPGAKVLIMDLNYRSNARIVSAADRFIQHNEARHEKHMKPVRNEGSDIQYVSLKSRGNQYGYLKKVAENCKEETAVLYRDNESVLPLVDQLERAGLPYRIKGADMTFFSNRVVNDVTNILRFAMNPYDSDLFMKIFFKCQTYLNKKQAEELCRISLEKNIPVPDAAAWASDLNGMVKGKCRALSTNLKAMKGEAPSKVLFRIEKPMGYGEYLEKNGIDAGKLFILKALSYNEKTIPGFLDRLTYLREMLKDKKPDYTCPFILSTIHSSKGLEYDRVYLMDICDGIFPSRTMPAGTDKTPLDIKEFEEERRLFYVGMTRAKNELNIFRFEDQSSCFVRELTVPKTKGQGSTAQSRPAALNISEGYTPKTGDRVVQKTEGSGTICSVKTDDKGKPQFKVEYDTGSIKTYAFPEAFKYSMWLEESRVEAPKKQPEPINKTEKKAANEKSPKEGSYAYWAEKYPDCVVIKKEGAFWTCRGKSAEIVHEVLGYKLGGKPESPVTGSPNIELMTEAFKARRLKYIVIDNNQLHEKY